MKKQSSELFHQYEIHLNHHLFNWSIENCDENSFMFVYHQKAAYLWNPHGVLIVSELVWV